MKTSSKYLSSGTLILIIVIIIALIINDFSGTLLLPLSWFVYYRLTIASEMPLLVQMVFISGVFLLIASLFKFSITGKFSLPGFHYNQLQSNEGSNLVYFASHAFDTLNGNSKKNSSVITNDSDKKPIGEQGIIMITSGSIMFANKAFFKMTGYQPLDVFGKDFASLIRPDSLINFTMLSRLTIKEIQQTRGISLISKNNNNIVAYTAATSENGFKPDGINIFYLKQENAAENTESTLDSLFFDSIENVETLHWIWDDKGIIYLNNSCRNNLPFTIGKVIGKPGLMLKAVRKEDRDAVRLALKEYSKSGKFNEEICCVQEDGEERYFKVNISVQNDNGSFPIRNHAIAYDITKEKRSLYHAESAALQAETANINKTAFLANMSHEIRSPLNGIIGFSELLADKHLTDDERERYLNIIQNNGNALISLLSDLIDISKLETGKLEITNRRFVPTSLMEELKHQFESSSYGKSENVKIIFNTNSSFKEQEIDSDPNRLRQILVNLITNAIKFTTVGRIEVGADFAGEEMLFWVKDSGIGIPHANQQAIFERYRQVDTNDARPIIGFGLGLAISKAIVELLGGHLWVESTPGQGSLFAFTIKTNIVINTTMETTQVNNSSYPFDFKEHTILIAEDIDFSFLYIEAVLRRTGVKILWAQNGKEAIEHVKTNLDIDLVLMDMHMPIINGYEATSMISSLRPGLPIIAQTAFVLPDDVKKCYAVGCSGYLAKPIRKDQLLNTLSEYFEKMEQHAETAPAYRVNVG
ncbi:MAG: ATP-binding protein [Bacteroidales bacterium]|nr:ATP-binding protein [Bacteroidales bacterium]